MRSSFLDFIHIWSWWYVLHVHAEARSQAVASWRKLSNCLVPIHDMVPTSPQQATTQFYLHDKTLGRGSIRRVVSRATMAPLSDTESESSSSSSSSDDDELLFRPAFPARPPAAASATTKCTGANVNDDCNGKQSREAGAAAAAGIKLLGPDT